MVPYVIYGNTDYLPILRIQTDYNKNLSHRTLLINEPNPICHEYDNVIFYKESDPYATRLLKCFKQISYDYFVLFHDFDIILNVDNNIIERLTNFLRTNNFDRIDLKHTFNINSTIYETELDFDLVKSEDPTDYIYNVNPSIWKRESYIEILENFKEANYREIECVVQEFCTKYNIFKLHSSNYLDCGWFFCLDFFKFLHITHSGKVLPLNSEFMTPSRQSYQDCASEYIEMYHKYNLGNVTLKHYLGR